MKFYPRDWRGDQALRSVSIAARGLWMEMLCIMHEANPYGHLVLNGEPVGVPTLARMAGLSEEEATTLLVELNRSGVYSVTRLGVIFSRRMTLDFSRAKKGKKAADKRWSQENENKQQNDRPNGFPNAPPTTHIPEKQKPEQHSSTDLEELESRLCSAAGITGNECGGLHYLGPILGLIDAGYSINEDIIPVVRSKNKGTFKPKSWAFYVEAIKEARARRLSISATPAPKAKEIDWDAWVSMHKNGSPWPTALGPEPGYDGCKAPREVLEKHGYLKLQAAE